MQVTKYVRSVLLKHLKGDTDNINDSTLATSAFDQFLHYEVVNATKTKMVPYHAIENLQTSVKQKQVPIDTGCEISCDFMSDPTVVVPKDRLIVASNEQFNPTKDVVASDSNGKRIEVEVTYEESVEFLLNEEDINITDENDNPLLVVG